YCIAYQSGGGVSACSSTGSFTLTSGTCTYGPGATSANCGGQVTIAPPPKVSYAYTFNVYVGATSGNLTWQFNCDLSQPAACVINWPLYAGLGTPPTSPNGVPAIILHGGDYGSGLISSSAGWGYLLIPASTMNVSNVVATEDQGQPFIQNVFMGSGAGRGTVTDSTL